MFEEINAHRLAVQENIKKAFEVGFTGNDIEKAHQVGDVHPNGKWVWTEYKPGKFDWRPPKKRGSADNTPKGSDASAKKEEDESDKKKLLERKDALDIEIKKLNNQIIVNGDSVRKVLQDKKKRLESEREDIAKRISKMSSDSQASSSSSKQAVDAGSITLKITNNGYGVVKLSDSVNAKWQDVKDEDFGGRIIGIKIDGKLGAKTFPYSFDSMKRKKYNLYTFEEAKAEAEKYLNNEKLKLTQQAIQKQTATQSQKTTPKKNPAELETISEVEDYAKSISGVTFKSVKSGWGDKSAKAFELTYPHGGKLVIDFLNNGEYVYELTDSNDKTIISTNSTDETSRTDWSIQLNPDKLVSRRVEVLKTKLTKLKGEETKARNKMIRDYSSFSDKYAYQKASEAVSDMKTKIQKLQSLIGTF